MGGGGTPIDGALAERFRDDLDALGSPRPVRLGLAVSGGADSLALLLLAHAALPGAVAAATVDHGVRPEATDEARSVADVCRDLGVPHDTLTLTLAGGGNLQARAREARYAALEEWARRSGVVAVATAHHRDDQAETLLMRAARGAGLSGLAGIRAATQLGGLRLIRPLLGWTRAELAAIVARAGLTPVDDPSNDSERHDRTHVRRLLAATPWLDPGRLAASAAHMAEAQEALDWTARDLWQHRATQDGGELALDASGLPAELRRRLLAEGLRRLGCADPPGPKLARLLDTLRSGKTGTLGGVRARGGAVWRLSAAPPRRES